MFQTIHTGGKKDEKIINVQDGISPYRTEKQSKINKWYMYLYSRLKSSANPVYVPTRHSSSSCLFLKFADVNLGNDFDPF